MSDSDIAIVGMAAHLPGAATPRQYWDNLRTGVESVRHFTDEELLAAGVSEQQLLRPGYVQAGAPLDGFAEFDAEFFGFCPKEAAIMDPQHRHFLEAAWEALEDAGHAPEELRRRDRRLRRLRHERATSCSTCCTNPDLVDDVGLFLLRHTGNDKDFLATRASYLLDLRGPSVNVQTACSTSLVAVHLAVQSLLSGECDMALAGGVTIELPHGRGYLYQEGEVLSPDGHCRAFDHRAQGTVFGSGAGVVVLRRLADAIADGDHIYAVIKGTAVNNDGAHKVGYLAPSVDGQAACIAEAHRGRRRRRRHDRLRRVPRHRHHRRRPDRDRRADRRRSGHRATTTGFCRDRLRQDQHRPPRHRGRRGEPDQGGAGAAQRRDPAEPELRAQQSRTSISSAARSSSTTD